MRPSVRGLTAITICALFLTSSASAQTFDSVGTRAQGMGGAFVGVADDASAGYWNPAGLARGAYFSLLIDGGTAEATPEGNLRAADRSGFLLALSTPPLGLSYYRLRSASVRPSIEAETPGVFRQDALLTHHAGITLVRTIIDGLAVGVTPKLVRAEVGSAIRSADAPEDLLDDWEVIERSTTRGDLDIGVMAVASFGSAGLTVRNVTEPSFDTPNDLEIQLDRQFRAGGMVLLLPTWKLAADFDLTENEGPFGAVRQVAIGTEAQVTKRFAARSGLRFNTAGNRGLTPAYSVGGSFAVFGSVLVDAQATGGSDETLRGWGLAGRVMF
jgi:F plasmid transfer operon, TraF, protein